MSSMERPENLRRTPEFKNFIDVSQKESGKALGWLLSTWISGAYGLVLDGIGIEEMTQERTTKGAIILGVGLMLNTFAYISNRLRKRSDRRIQEAFQETAIPEEILSLSESFARSTPQKAN